MRFAFVDRDSWAVSANIVLEIYASLDSLEPLLKEAFIQFLDKHAKKNFEQCIPFVKDALIEGSKGHKIAENKLDKFFGSSLVQTYNDEVMFDFLSKLDLGTSETFQIKQSIETATDLEYPVGKETLLNILYRFMSTHCHELRRNR